MFDAARRPRSLDHWFRWGVPLVLAVLLFCAPLSAQAQHPTAVTSIVNSAQDTTLEVNHNGSLLMPGTFDPAARNDSIPAEGAGTRLLWYPAKAAFRAGQVSSADWEASNIGVHSVAFGQDTEAPGAGSAALGTFTIAIGNQSTAMGSNTTAATSQSLSIGECNSANTSSDKTLFVAGNGVFDLVDGSCNRSDAMVLKKNGRLTTAGTVESESGGFVLPDGTVLDEASDLGQLSLPFSEIASESSPLFQLTQTGSSNAGRFIIDNTSSSANALFAFTSGSGNALDVSTSGSGRAGLFEINNTSSGADALQAETNGSGNALIARNTGNGPAGSFVIDNSSSSSNTLGAFTNGSGNALSASTSGSGFAGVFRASVNADARGNPGANVALIKNISAGDGGDVLALQAGETDGNIQDNTNFITFYGSGGGDIGALEGMGGSGVQLSSGGADFAEELPVAGGSPTPEPADLVSVRGGKVSLGTKDARRLMIVSSTPVVTGNTTPSAGGDDSRRVPVAFVGQVPAKVRGKAKVGDLIVPSGKADGTARAVSPSEYRRAEHGPIAGQAWSSKTSNDVGEVTVAVGLGRSGAVAERMEDQSGRIAELESENEEIKKRLAAVETGRASSAIAGLARSGTGLLLAFLFGGLLGTGLLWRRQDG